MVNLLLLLAGLMIITWEHCGGKASDLGHKRFKTFSCGLLFNPCSAWIGCHYSEYNRRYCINVVPFVTFWITKRSGKEPSKEVS